MRFEHTQVFNFKGTIRGMRNPLESWNKSDSGYCDTEDYDCDECEYSSNCPLNLSAEDHAYVIGKNDMKLAQKLIKAGTEHRKFLRQIMVSVDITAPLYWWKEFDTYKVGTTANSTSTMHRLSNTQITLDCFETDDYDASIFTDSSEIDYLIQFLETLRCKYNATKDKRYWKELIRWFPESWLQTRTVTMNYENLRSMVVHRRNHKLSEWSKSFMDWINSLPYSSELIKYGLEENNEV